jgi:hypothetical protein
MMVKFVMEQALSLAAATSRLPIKTETQALEAQVFMNTLSSTFNCRNALS